MLKIFQKSAIWGKSFNIVSYLFNQNNINIWLHFSKKGILWLFCHAFIKLKCTCDLWALVFEKNQNKTTPKSEKHSNFSTIGMSRSRIEKIQLFDLLTFSMILYYTSLNQIIRLWSDDNLRFSTRFTAPEAAIGALIKPHHIIALWFVIMYMIMLQI